jgi:hypothetical protein
MGGTTYYAVTAERQLAEAQRILDTHVTSSRDGRCCACGLPGPCSRRATAVVVFSRSLRLPRRATGAALTGTGTDGDRFRFTLPEPESRPARIRCPGP